MTMRNRPISPAPHPSDPEWAEISLIAEHRSLSPEVAASRREELLAHAWGPAAIRQMLYDQWCKAPDPAMAEWIWQAFERFDSANPAMVDRRAHRR